MHQISQFKMFIVKICKKDSQIVVGGLETYFLTIDRSNRPKKKERERRK